MKSSSPLFPFEHSHLLQTAMPLGGIGAGNVCLNGYGGLQDFSIHNQPATTALPDKFHGEEVAFAVLHIQGEKPITRLIEGRIPVEKIYDQGLKSQVFVTTAPRVFRVFIELDFAAVTLLGPSNYPTRKYPCRCS
jgi:hypothetical protein